MNINLRGISEELHQLMKVRAASECVTLQSLCVRFMWQGLDVAGDDSKRVGLGSQPKPAPNVGAERDELVGSHRNDVKSSAALDSKPAPTIASIGPLDLEALRAANGPLVQTVGLDRFAPVTMNPAMKRFIGGLSEMKYGDGAGVVSANEWEHFQSASTTSEALVTPPLLAAESLKLDADLANPGMREIIEKTSKSNQKQVQHGQILEMVQVETSPLPKDGLRAIDVESGPANDGFRSVSLCPYTEWHEGEQYRCALPVHGLKTKHVRGERVC